MGMGGVVAGWVERFAGAGVCAGACTGVDDRPCLTHALTHSHQHTHTLTVTATLTCSTPTHLPHPLIPRSDLDARLSLTSPLLALTPNLTHISHSPNTHPSPSPLAATWTPACASPPRSWPPAPAPLTAPRYSPSSFLTAPSPPSGTSPSPPCQRAPVWPCQTTPCRSQRSWRRGSTSRGRCQKRLRTCTRVRPRIGGRRGRGRAGRRRVRVGGRQRGSGCCGGGW